MYTTTHSSAMMVTADPGRNMPKPKREQAYGTSLPPDFTDLTGILETIVQASGHFFASDIGQRSKAFFGRVSKVNASVIRSNGLPQLAGHGFETRFSSKHLESKIVKQTVSCALPT